MSYRKPLFVALSLCFFASAVLAQQSPNLSAASQQLKKQNPTLAKGSKVNLVELKVAGAKEALGGILAEARYQAADGSTFRTELYFVRNSQLTRIDNGLMAAKLLSGTMLKKDLYYSWAGGSGVHQCYVGKLSLVAGKIAKLDACISLKNDLYLRAKQDSVAVLRLIEGRSKRHKLVGTIAIKDGKLRVVDEKGNPVSL